MIVGGVTGDTTIEPVTDDKETLCFPGTIIKLSFGRAEGKHMRDEYNVYQHLSSCGMTGFSGYLKMLRVMQWRS